MSIREIVPSEDGGESGADGEESSGNLVPAARSSGFEVEDVGSLLSSDLQSDAGSNMHLPVDASVGFEDGVGRG